MYQILQKFDIHWHDGGPSIAMMCHLRGVSDLLCNWKSCLLCYMKDVVLHCSIFFKWNKLVRVRVRESSSSLMPWLLASRSHQQPRHWLFGIYGSSDGRVWFLNYLRHPDVERWWKMLTNTKCFCFLTILLHVNGCDVTKSWYWVWIDPN